MHKGDMSFADIEHETQGHSLSAPHIGRLKKLSNRNYRELKQYTKADCDKRCEAFGNNFSSIINIHLNTLSTELLSTQTGECKRLWLSPALKAVRLEFAKKYVMKVQYQQRHIVI
jgi:hypothetical protein